MERTAADVFTSFPVQSISQCRSRIIWDIEMQTNGCKQWDNTAGGKCNIFDHNLFFYNYANINVKITA